MPTAPVTVTYDVQDRYTAAAEAIREELGGLAIIVEINHRSPLGCLVVWTNAGRWEAVYPAVWDGDQA